ncbi:MAG: hypothetical protein Q9180_004853 [Flavoplaca navasiana]
MCSREQHFALAYFYFAFDDPAFQSVEGLIRSLVTQLCAQSTSIPQCVDSLYSKRSEGRSQPMPPSHGSLRNVLCQLLGSFKQVFVVLDALDECTERHDLILAVEEIVGWQKSELHLLSTSRRELELEECMNTLTAEADRIAIQGMPVEADIKSYVLGRLCTDRRLKRWHKPELEKEIVMTLTSKAHGICRSVFELRGALQSLPKDLDDTYARILKAIDDEGHYAQVFKILQLLIGSNEPVPVDEAAETITIELDNTPQVDLDRRLIDSDDVLSMCSALVILEKREKDKYGKNRVLRLAHFSIQEYLLSTRIRESTVSHWQMDNILCHLSIARLFIAYILFLEVDSGATPNWPSKHRQLNLEYPLAVTAISRWPEHLSIAENNDVNHVCRDLGSQLFTTHSAAKRSWIMLSIHTHGNFCFNLFTDIDQWVGDFGIRRDSLAFTAHHNLPQTTRSLLARGANPDIIVQSRQRCANPAMMFRSPQSYGVSWVTPLTEASRMGHLRVVKALLDNGADVGFQRNGCPNALIQACRMCNTEVVRLLLEHGANPNASVPNPFTPLGEALNTGSYRYTVDTNSLCNLVHTLPKAGADVAHPLALEDTQRFNGWLPIEWAAFTYGVDGLVAACDIKDDEVEEYLEAILFFLNHGIDVNARSLVTAGNDSRPWAGRTALETACRQNDLTFVRMALDHGANPNLRSPVVESALEAFLNRPDIGLECDTAPVFVLLISHGADIELVREDKLTEYGKSKYRIIMERWISLTTLIDTIGERYTECLNSWLCAEVRDATSDDRMSDDDASDDETSACTDSDSCWRCGCHFSSE